MMLGQESNLVSYQRRFSILLNLVKDTRKANSLLKVKAILLQIHNRILLAKKIPCTYN